MKLVIITGVWQRPEVFEMFARATKKLKHEDVEIKVVVAGSEGKKTEKAVTSHGFYYMEVPNQPLAEKMNATVEGAKQLEADYVLCVGSDDIITQELLDIYVEQMKAGVDFVGVLDWYFFDTVSKRFAYWGGYREQWRKGHTCGAGRLLSKRLLEQWGWAIWENRHSTILDTSMQQKLEKTKHKSYIFSLKEKGVLAFDIKSATNMTPFQLWDNTKYINDSTIKKQFNQLIK